MDFLYIKSSIFSCYLWPKLRVLNIRLNVFDAFEFPFILAQHSYSMPFPLQHSTLLLANVKSYCQISLIMWQHFSHWTFFWANKSIFCGICFAHLCWESIWICFASIMNLILPYFLYHIHLLFLDYFLH